MAYPVHYLKVSNNQMGRKLLVLSMRCLVLFLLCFFSATARADDNPNFLIDIGTHQSVASSSGESTFTNIKGRVTEKPTSGSQSGTSEDVGFSVGNNPRSPIVASVSFANNSVDTESNGKPGSYDVHTQSFDLQYLFYRGMVNRGMAGFAPVVGADYVQSRNSDTVTRTEGLDGGIAYVTPMSRTMVLAGVSHQASPDSMGVDYEGNGRSLQVLTQQEINTILSVSAAIAYGQSSGERLGPSMVSRSSGHSESFTLGAKAMLGEHAYVRAEWVYSGNKSQVNSITDSLKGESSMLGESAGTGHTLGVSAGVAF